MFLEHLDLSLPLFWSAPDVLTPEECGEIIQRARLQDDWKHATVNSRQGRVADAGLRNNTLTILDEPSLAARLVERLGEHIPPAFKGRPVFGVGPRMRCYRYEVDQRFGVHTDQCYRGPDQPDGAELWSELTLLVYLNDDFGGGETSFPDHGQVITPQTGSALLFQHAIPHAGERVTRGVKYLLRTDVFYLRRSEK